MLIINRLVDLLEKALKFYYRIKPKKTFWSIAVPYFLFILGWIANNLERLVQFLNNQFGQSESIIGKAFWGALALWASIDLPVSVILIVTAIFLPFVYLYYLELKSKREGNSIEEKINNLFSKLNQDLISKIEDLKSYFTFQVTDEWIDNQCHLSVLELGSRYTPKLNFQLEISEVFDGLGRTADFKSRADGLFDTFFIKGKKLLSDDKQIKTYVDSLELLLTDLFDFYNSVSFFGISNLPVKEFNSKIRTISSLVDELSAFYRDEENKLQQEKNDYRSHQKYGSELSEIRDFKNSLHDVLNFLNGDICNLANSSILVLDGEAGIGKSHLFGDVVIKRLENDYDSIFLLGQHFVTDEDPWTQIFKKLNINTTREKFLEQLNNRAKKKGKRCIIFIDAINEGRGRYFWPNNIRSFISEIIYYDWLGLAVSVRTSYKKLIFPENDFSDLQFTAVTHFGFRSYEYEASKMFFESYGIELPSIPLLNPEFENPLFLKLFCEGLAKAGLSKIPEGFHGISKIINFFVESVNQTLSKPDRLDYSPGINIVQKSIDALVKLKIRKPIGYIPYEKAYVTIDKAVSKYIDRKGIIEDLISEGVLSKNVFWKSDNESEEGVYIAYERFEDHLTAKYLLDESSDIEEAFKEGGRLYEYVKNDNACFLHKGLIDSFSVQVPELVGKEFFELIPNLKGEYTIVESFVLSLQWRKRDSFSDSAIDYVNKYVWSYSGTRRLFLEVLFTITAVPGHYFNAEFLHRNLMNFSLPDRDGWWTQELKYKFADDSTAKRLIDWGWGKNNKNHISDDAIFLSCVALGWLHTTTNRELRDSATKAMVCLLQNRIDILIDLLKTFDGVNDPYVYERLFAVTLACSLRTNEKEKLKNLSEYIFETIFNNKDEVYPHILLRDYARTVIEYTNYLGYELSFDIELAYPPYKSSLPDSAMTIKQIDKKYKFNYKDAEFKDHYWSQNSILDSMTTEYGRGVSNYGDFGRYVFQSALRDWDVNPNKLSNLAVEWIFEKYGYDVKKHGEYDRNLDSYGRSSSSIERIGKKYQWIAFYEILARVADNCKKIDSWGEGKTELKYQGTYDPYVRDIDPTIIITDTPEYDSEKAKENWWCKESYSNWEMPDKVWIHYSDDLISPSKLISLVDDTGEEWLALEGHPGWSEPRKLGEEKWSITRKSLWYQLRSYFVKITEFETMKDWLVNQNFMGRWMPESGTRYELFSREYYWSKAYGFFCQDYYSGSEWNTVYDRKNRKPIGSVSVPVINFHWEEEFDKSKKSTISYLKPSHQLFHGMNMALSEHEGEFIDDQGNTICFDPSVNNISKSFLLVKKQPFLKFLSENDLKVIWTVLGEKQMIGGGVSKQNYIGRLELNGCYFLDNAANMDGFVNTKPK